ncbi:MAG TPA: DUF4926 domain-containing protein [Thermoanaerobaculia bacterium]|nr:DUF4926 domain-containing protein [Thermoanaerobaculia bacterium]
MAVASLSDVQRHENRREDVRDRRLSRGEVSTVVEVLESDLYELEFSDDRGATYAELALRRDQLVLLHNRGDKFKIIA